jgi:hypothetical protein
LLESPGNKTTGSKKVPNEIAIRGTRIGNGIIKILHR